MEWDNMEMKTKAIMGVNVGPLTDKEHKKFLRQERIRHIKWKISMCIPLRIRNGWDNLRYFLKPRQRWLTKKIPNSWVDKDILWEICILESIKHYVEQDGGLGYNPQDYEASQADPSYPDEQKVFDREVFSNYNLITVRIPELEVQLKKAWDEVPDRDLDDVRVGVDDYTKVYGEVDRLTDEIENLKTEIMVWAVKNRGRIWT